VRLACVKRAASVDSEPGSNSRLILLRHAAELQKILPGHRLGLTQSSDELTSASNQIFKDLRDQSRDPHFFKRRRPDRPPASKAVLAQAILTNEQNA
jgi:hypothetical protein